MTILREGVHGYDHISQPNERLLHFEGFPFITVVDLGGMIVYSYGHFNMISRMYRAHVFV
jgi:hypothetical protein